MDDYGKWSQRRLRHLSKQYGLKTDVAIDRIRSAGCRAGEKLPFKLIFSKFIFLDILSCEGGETSRRDTVLPRVKYL